MLRLAEQLDAALRDRNALLLAAGFAPAFPRRSLDDPALAAAREVIDRVLTGHEPYPALAIDRHWTLIAANRVVPPLLSGCRSQLAAAADQRPAPQSAPGRVGAADRESARVAAASPGAPRQRWSSPPIRGWRSCSRSCVAIPHQSPATRCDRNDAREKARVLPVSRCPSTRNRARDAQLHQHDDGLWHGG